MKVAVTGARGFLGRHLIAELGNYDVEVIATERPGRPASGPTAANVRWVKIDVSTPREDYFSLLDKPDVLIHLAWAGLPNYRSLHHFETELPVHYRFLRGLIQQGLRSLIVTGTCFEYGDQSGALAANAETRPNNPYGFAKDSLRKQLEYLRGTLQFELTWARLFYLYGEGQPETSLLTQLKSVIADGGAVFNMSGGEQLRDYLSATAAARLLGRLALHHADRGVVNICSGVPISVRSLVEGWIKQNDWKVTLNLGHLPYVDYEPMAFWGIPTDGDSESCDDCQRNEHYRNDTVPITPST